MGGDKKGLPGEVKKKKKKAVVWTSTKGAKQ